VKNPAPTITKSLLLDHAAWKIRLVKQKQVTMADDANCTRAGRFHCRCANILTSWRSASFIPPTTDDDTNHEAEHDDATDEGHGDIVQTLVEAITVYMRRQYR